MSPVRDNNVVALFPGQGSLTTGAGEPWASLPSWEIVREISEVTNVDVAHLLLTAEQDEVVRTDNAQLATYTLSLVGWYSYLEPHNLPEFFVGHSLGEFTALVAAGVLDYTAGAHLVHARGRAMQRANEVNPGTMAALMGGDGDALSRLGEIENLWLANLNGEGQTVVSGSLDAIEELERRGKEIGWRRVTRLSVGGAFHSPLMAPAQRDLDNVLGATHFQETDASIFANVDGALHNGGAIWRTLLSRQLTEPVQFLRAVTAIPALATHTIEMPPGSILTGLMKRIRTFTEQRVAQPKEGQL
ncbi:MAG: ACP S-malonyltransferase [Actinomycetes bacterium]